MPRPPVSDEINRGIVYYWIAEENQAAREGRTPKAINAWRMMHNHAKREPLKHDPPRDEHKVSLRAFQQRVRAIKRARRGAPDENLVLAPKPWLPWANPEEAAEDTAFLLQMQEVKWAEQGIGLHELEAKWARQLRVAVEGFHPFGQYRLVMAYATREMIGNDLRQPPWTRDLDSFIAYKPWLPGKHHAYELAVATGIAPILNLDVDNLLSGLPLPEPKNLREEVRLTWAPQSFWWFTPWGTSIPGWENDPERADRLGLLLKSWAGNKLKLRRRYQRQQSVLKRQAKNRRMSTLRKATNPMSTATKGEEESS
jgi:hypothetical protein